MVCVRKNESSRLIFRHGLECGQFESVPHRRECPIYLFAALKLTGSEEIHARSQVNHLWTLQKEDSTLRAFPSPRLNSRAHVGRLNKT